MKYELAICVANEPEAHRKKRGDILAVAPHPFNWGAKEIDSNLIVIVETDKDLIEFLNNERTNTRFKNRFRMSFRKAFEVLNTTGSDKEKQVILGLDMAKVIDKKEIYQPFKAAGQLLQKFIGDSDYEQEVVNGKRHIKKTRETSVNYKKVYDKVLGEYVTVKRGSRKINILKPVLRETVSVSPGIIEDEEFCINLDALPPVIFDKFKDKWVKP